MITISNTIPDKDIEEARRRGYRVIRPIHTFSSDEGAVSQRTQVRTGFDIETGREIWRDLDAVVNEDEWQAELVSMTHDKFVEFIGWLWSDNDSGAR